ncbi:MAG: InlB B-repeat-containing protein [Lachnospiraceae bacterium]|nr:InlB B-repeat-containing protein [Lachnospiraceae bacterium]
MKINNTIIENCSSDRCAGAIYVASGDVSINSGTFKNNKSMQGGCITAYRSDLTINDGDFIGNTADEGGCIAAYDGNGLTIENGNFIGNTADTKGGCIMAYSGVATINGGHFEGNKCSKEGYEGSGAVYVDIYSGLDLSSDAHFCGDASYGTDGIMPDNYNYVRIRGTLNYPATIYVKAYDGRVIAAGGGDYILSIKNDLEKIQFVDIGDSGETYYKVLDKENNYIYLSTTEPEYGYFVTYHSNGAEGNVTDDKKYTDIDNTVTVKDAADLSYEGYVFDSWNTKADGTGESYNPNDTFTITSDTDLYAQWKEVKLLTAWFYSGDENTVETIETPIEDGEDSAVIKTPALEPIPDWAALGWNKSKSGYTGDIAQGAEIEIPEDTPFYGVYKKDVTLSYDANYNTSGDGNGNSGNPAGSGDNEDGSFPEGETAALYANVNETSITYKEADFILAKAPVRIGYAFEGWNTKADGTGDKYEPEAAFTAQSDITLYAQWSRIVTATFYSGADNHKAEKKAVINTATSSGTIITPLLMGMEGWSIVGWDRSENGYSGDIAQDSRIEISVDTSFYGVYKKDAELSYDVNYSLGNENESGNNASDSTQASDAVPTPDAAPESNMGTIYASINEKTITYKYPSLTLAPAPSRDGYVFTGWNTSPDGNGGTYNAGTVFELRSDTTLYAQWAPETAAYTVEHYLQDLSGAGYTREEADTENLSGAVGEVVNAMPKVYPGFTENTVHESRKESGVVVSDGTLVLRFYYDRNVYNVAFDLNGGTGTAPRAQELRYGAFLQEVARPARPGYTFLGWYKDELGTEGKAWDFGKAVEENTENKSETLYAGWVDDIAPELMQPRLNEGYKSFHDWLIRKKDLIITVPIIEEGSGVKQADYVLTSFERADRENVTEQAQAITPGQAQITEENGRTVAKITISNDFRGSVSMTCSDNAGNISAGKTLTAPEGGAAFIVEDNAPKITFWSKDGSLSGSFYGNVTVNVLVNDEGTLDIYGTATEDVKVTGGIASVTYSIDNGAETAVEGKGFESGIVPSCGFSVEISGVGEHILRVTATDNAGNESMGHTRIKIALKTAERKKVRTVINNDPSTSEPVQFIALADAPQPLKNAIPVRDREPETRDNSHVDVYAAIAMVTGLLYLLLYFTTDRNGMTEEEKEQLISHLVSWAKRGGKLRRRLAIAAIFIFLAYYHSIGKSTAIVGKEIYG